MPLNSGAHKEKVIDGVSCRMVEEGLSAERMEFLKKLLEHNGFEVKVERHTSGETEDNTVDNGVPKPNETYTLWVTDLLFNPVIYVYALQMKTPGNKIVTPAYWLQMAPEGIEKGEPDYYWELAKKK